MRKIEQVTADALQKRTLILPDQSQVTFTMYYCPNQFGWFIKSLVYGEFALNGIRIVNSPNFLYQYRNRIPFGIGCISGSSKDIRTMREPTQQDDFVSGFSNLYLLDQDETIALTRFFRGQV